MKTIRKRFTISSQDLAVAEEYARLDNRTFSELVCEALRQHMYRYPQSQKKASQAVENTLDARLSALEEIVAQRYEHVPFTGSQRQVTGADGVPETVRA